LSVGQALRDTGEFQDFTNTGKLVPDEAVIDLMNRQISKAEDEGFDVILDGYPRTKVQAEYIVDHMADKIDGAIILEVPKDELYERLALRGRDDDKERESIDRRFEIFETNIGEILPLLEAHNIPVERIDGVGEIGTVTGRLLATVKRFCPNATMQSSDVNGGEIEKSYGE
jgi:adenylate kinase family enzyme